MISLPVLRDLAKCNFSFAAWKSLRCLQETRFYSSTHASVQEDAASAISTARLRKDVHSKSKSASPSDDHFTMKVFRRRTKMLESDDRTSQHQRRFCNYKTLRKQEIMAILSKPTGTVIGEDESDHDIFHHPCFIGKTVTAELKKQIEMLLDAGLDASELPSTIFATSPAILQMKINILRDYTIKISSPALIRFNYILSASLKQLHSFGHLDEPRVAIRNIIKSLPISEEAINYLLEHPSFNHEQVGCYSLMCLCNEIVNTYKEYKFPCLDIHSINVLYHKKFRRLADSIRIISLLASTEYNITSSGMNKIITHGNPFLIEFFQKNPSYLHGLPINILFKSQSSHILGRSVAQLTSAMDTYFGRLKFHPRTLDSMDVFILTSEELIARSEYWFKFFGKEQITMTPRSSKLLLKFEHYKYKYSLVRPELSSENATVDHFDDIKVLLTAYKNRKISDTVKSLYTQFGWDYNKVKKRYSLENLKEILKIDPTDLVYYEANQIADYLLKEMKFSDVQVSSVPVIFCLPLAKVKQIVKKYKDQIEAPEWKHHPLVLDYVLFSYFNEKSDIHQAIAEVE